MAQLIAKAKRIDSESGGFYIELPAGVRLVFDKFSDFVYSYHYKDPKWE